MPANMVMSFAMANSGYSFATWLRDQLMKRYSLHYPDSVYVDFHTARLLPGKVDIQPDKRPPMLSSTGAFPIGARRDDWNSLFMTAVSQAKVMLVNFTDEYVASKWCMEEYDLIAAQNQTRGASGRPLMRGVVLEFTSAEGKLPGLDAPYITRLRVSKTPGGGRGLAWDKSDYILSPSDFSALVNAIGQDV